jgi:hypothetical protein
MVCSLMWLNSPLFTRPFNKNPLMRPILTSWQSSSPLHEIAPMLPHMLASLIHALRTLPTSNFQFDYQYMTRLYFTQALCRPLLFTALPPSRFQHRLFPLHHYWSCLNVRPHGPQKLPRVNSMAHGRCGMLFAQCVIITHGWLWVGFLFSLGPKLCNAQNLYCINH